jgi:hypothetical protein
MSEHFVYQSDDSCEDEDDDNSVDNSEAIEAANQAIEFSISRVKLMAESVADRARNFLKKVDPDKIPTAPSDIGDVIACGNYHMALREEFMKVYRGDCPEELEDDCQIIYIRYCSLSDFNEKQRAFRDEISKSLREIK